MEASDRLTFDLRGSVNQLRTQGLYYNIVGDVNTIADVEVNNPGQNDRDIYNLALKIEYAGDNAVLTSVSSYDTVKEVLTGDAFDFKPIPESFFFNLFEFLFGPGNGFDLNQSQYLNVKAFSQEVRLASPEDGRAFNWMVGGYLIDTTRFISTGNMIDTGNGMFPVFRSPSTNPLNPQFSYLADGQETTITSFHTTLLHHGMVIVGLPYTFAGNSEMGEISGGTPYGASTLAGNDGSRMPSENELAGARFQGAHVAQIAAKLAA